MRYEVVRDKFPPIKFSDLENARKAAQELCDKCFLCDDVRVFHKDDDGKIVRTDIFRRK